MDFTINNINVSGSHINDEYHADLRVELAIYVMESNSGFQFETEVYLPDSGSLSTEEVKNRAIEIAKERLKIASNQI
ncbi:hypothetical protein ABLA30_09560 [Xenorhabdus nematophila]|uniref:hypothetical protein n=1 Tax=Xenorhabdus nematophila TaxID=628 RepID=UPI0032B7C087